MNAMENVVRIKDALANAGFNVEVVEESATRVAYWITTNTTNIFETRESFYVAASKLNSTNRWNKFFSYSTSTLGLSEFDRNDSNVTYSEIWSRVNAAVRYANIKVGA
jgi:hypothetical protein